jgi:MFS family permease
LAIPALSPLQDSAVRRDLFFDLTSWVGFGVTSALLGSMLPAIARRDGMEPVGIAILAAIPYAASLLSVTAGRVGPRAPRQLAALRVVGAAALAFVLLGSGVLWVAAAASIFWLAHMFGMPVQQRLWGVIYPTSSRGRLLSVVSTGRYAAAGLALLLGGLLAARVDGTVVVALGGIVGAVLAVSTARIARGDVSAAVETFSVRRALRAVLDHRPVRQATLAHALFGGGLATAVPLITLIQVDRLDLGLAAIGVTGMVGAIATLGSLLAWGAIADRHGPFAVLQAAGILGVMGLSLFAIAGDHLAVIAASVVIGVTNGAIEVAFTLLIANHVAPRQQAAANAGSNAIFGIRGLIAPVAVVTLLQLGVLDIERALALCVGAAIGGAILYLRAAGEHAETERRLTRLPGWVAGRVRRGGGSVASGGHAIASVIGSRFASLR